MNKFKNLRQKIGLGTVQFGMDYGISNVLKQTSSAEVKQILDYASKHDLTVLDTAESYGDSETVIGESMLGNHHFRIVTKICPCDGNFITKDHAADAIAGFHRSLIKLRQQSLYGLLVHNCDDLLKPGGELLLDVLKRQKAEGHVQKIGVSVYTGKQIDLVLRLFTPDIIQLPLNILDQRLIEQGWLSLLKTLGVEIHARSIFLQGLLLMDLDLLNDYFNPIKGHLSEFQNTLNLLGITPLEAALDFALKQVDIDTVILGVAALSELKEICSVVNHKRDYNMDYAKWALYDTRFLDPSQWNFSREMIKV